jgi:transposase
VLLGNRRCLLGKRLDIENRIRGTLKVFGLKTGKVSTGRYEARIQELMEGDETLALCIEPLLEVRRHLQEQFCKLDKAIRDIVKEDEVCRRLMTIPGVGALTALAFKTSIDRPERFGKSRNVGAALGLTPRKYASGEVDYDGRITKCGDALARVHLYEAAKVLMSRVTKWSSLKAWGMKIARRSSMKNACVAVARKLAVIMHRMWVDGTEFHWGSNPESAAA